MNLYAILDYVVQLHCRLKVDYDVACRVMQACAYCSTNKESGHTSSAEGERNPGIMSGIQGDTAVAANAPGAGSASQNMR
jgi:hypothetical protein